MLKQILIPQPSSHSGISFLLVILQPQFRMAETPFRPREKLIEKQKHYQSLVNYTHLRKPMDRLTSVAIPLALAASSVLLIGRGIYKMSHGIGKKDA